MKEDVIWNHQKEFVDGPNKLPEELLLLLIQGCRRHKRYYYFTEMVDGR